ncbi:MAG: polysaccharide biosynthesis tyrosine autokinase [Alphaproteobacteria bacterium]|nr:polysaccharide biosynthesis tyrosine autokinase [Alphaproteobacteria bacterium]
MLGDGASGRKGSSLAERVASRMAAGTLVSLHKAPAPAAPPVVPIEPEFFPATPAPMVSATPVPMVAKLAAVVEKSPEPEKFSEPAASTPPIHINLHRLKSAGVVTPDSPRSVNTEEFRVIKRYLMKIAFPEDPATRIKNSNVIMVTSSIPGEGKTFTSLNLAMSFSMERNLYILLVDADNHRHSLSAMIEADISNVGLIDLLVDHSLHMRDIIFHTDIPNLSFIPAGRPHPQATELLSSKDMATLIGELASRYPDRLIIIDTPPLLASTEGAVLSSHVGHAVVVVEKDRTPKRSLQRTLEMLDGCQNVSCILNMDTTEHSFSQYAYGYGNASEKK